MAVVAAGSVSDFTPFLRQSIIHNLAVACQLPTNAIVLTVAPASVLLTFEIALPSMSEATRVAAILTPKLASVSNATALLSLSFYPVSVVDIVALPNIVDSGGPSAGGDAGAVFGVIFGVIFALGFIFWFGSRYCKSLSTERKQLFDGAVGSPKSDGVQLQRVPEYQAKI